MYQARHLMTALRCGNDTYAEIYHGVAKQHNITYDEAKEKVKNHTEEYLRNSYELRKRFAGYGKAFEHFLREEATAITTVNYLTSTLLKNNEGYFGIPNLQ